MVAARELKGTDAQRCHAVERRQWHAAAFHTPYRKAIERLTAHSVWLEDLAHTFPGMLFALASGYGSAAARTRAIRLVTCGAPLRQAAEALGLPWWLRRMPAASFRDTLRYVPDGPRFVTRVSALVPTGDVETRTWLWGIVYANRYCHEEFALWAGGWLGASARVFSLPYGEDTFRYLTAWAWASSHPETRLGQLLGRPWTPSIGLRRALDDLALWRLRIDLALCLAERDGAAWLAPGSASGYDFVLLDTVEAFIDEARAMDNCLDIYGAKLRLNQSSVYSVRRHGQRVAVLEIGPHQDNAAMPALLQLRTRRNQRASAEVWKAAYHWMGNYHPPPCIGRSPSRARTAVQELWQPYLRWQSERGKDARFRSLVLGELGGKGRGSRKTKAAGARPGRDRS